MDLHEQLRSLAAALGGEEHNPFRGVAGRDPEVQMEVLRNNTLGSRIDAILAVYPRVTRLVGERFAQALAERFAQATPADQPDIAAYGEGFSGFLETFEHTREITYLADVARLEWSRHLAFQAAPVSRLALNELAAMAPEQQVKAILEVNPTLTVIHSHSPLHDIWLYADPDGERGEVPNLDQDPQSVVLWRSDGLESVMNTAVITPIEQAFLRGCQQGIALGPLGTGLETDLGPLLARAAVTQWVIGYR